MKKLNILLAFCLALIVLLIVSCRKNDGAPHEVPDPNPVANPFVTCDCNPEARQYIRGEFNGAKMCFDKTYSATDTFSNVNFYQAGKQDQINMLRKSKDGRVVCGFFIINSNVFGRSLPYIMPHENQVLCEHTEFQLLNLNQQWASKCQGCETDNADYFAEAWQSFYINISDTTGGYLKGTFKGKAMTKTGKELIVNNGEFNIYIIKKAVKL